MNNYIPYNMNQSYQATQYFPSPQGNVYIVNSALEVSNVPMGTGFSVVLCPSESTMYIKTLQGGAPTLMVYKLTPYETKEKAAPEKQEQPDIIKQIEDLSKQVSELKKQMNGGRIDELL